MPRSSEAIKSFQPGLHLVYSQTKGGLLINNPSSDSMDSCDENVVNYLLLYIALFTLCP